MRGNGWSVHFTPNAHNIFALELCVSDVHKKLLLNNKDFIPYLIDALLLDPAHPRAGMADEHKSWLQTNTAECLAQLAVFEPGRDALLQAPTVAEALQGVSERGLSEQSREDATAALRALKCQKLQMRAEGQKHIMLSCETTFLCLYLLHFPLYTAADSHFCLRRPMGLSSYRAADQRVTDCSQLHHMVRPDQHEGQHHGCDVRRYRGSRCDAVFCFTLL